MINRLPIAIILFFSTIFTACNKEIPKDLPNAVVDVYVAGYDNGYVCYWKNGTKVILATTTIGEGVANGIAVSGMDVYVVGKVKWGATIGKNGIATQLTDGNSSADARAITLIGNDVYIAGFQWGAGIGNSILYWKNGIKIVLHSSGGDPSANAIAFAGGDVYVAGNVDVRPMYWKNGVGTHLTASNTTSGYANSIFISGVDVYIAGVEDGKAVYWKNRVKTQLSNISSIAKGIVVEGKDVYVIGSEDWGTAVYWKNGVKTVLAISTYGYASANAITINKSEVYIAGTVGVNGGSQPCYWKNGIKTTLPSYYGSSHANAIQVVNQ